MIQGEFFDGITSAKHPVTLICEPQRLRIIGAQVHCEYSPAQVSASNRLGSAPRWLYFSDGACCSVDNHALADSFAKSSRAITWAAKWEQRPAYVVIALLLLIATLWIGLDRGVPLLAQEIADRIPPSAEASLGQEALEQADEYLFEPSTMSEDWKQELTDRFNELARIAGGEHAYRLEFRASPVIGANAFALPGGTVVMTDELVDLSENDDEVLAVLAHEIGHVKHRHSLRQLLQNTATGLIIAGITGDVTSITSLAAAVPTFLMQAKYSRVHESEADRYALELMRETGIEPHHFPAILNRLQATDEDEGPAFLSTHPATAERAQLFKQK
ncbi:MAG: M48 family metallopeptidase [Burkholderiales bacterium]